MDLLFLLQMLVKQKEANRQSMLLLQSAEPSIQLLKALEDVAAVSRTLEEERLQHQQQVRRRPASADGGPAAKLEAREAHEVKTSVNQFKPAVVALTTVPGCRCRAWRPGWSRAV